MCPATGLEKPKAVSRTQLTTTNRRRRGKSNCRWAARIVDVDHFAILLPFYRQNVESWRDFSALMAALVFIVFLFWHLNYHYMNIVFALRGYRVLSVLTPEGDSEGSSMKNFALITRRSSVEPNERLVAYRLSNTVYLEKNK